MCICCGYPVVIEWGTVWSQTVDGVLSSEVEHEHLEL